MVLDGRVDPDIGKVKICTGHTRPICHISYSKVVDGSFWFVTSCHDGKPMLRNGETGDWVGTFEGHRGAVYCSAFNNSATRVATGSGDYSVIVWDALNGTNLNTWSHPHYIKCLDWHDDMIATGCFDANIRLYDANKYDMEPTMFHAHDKVVKACYFLDANTLVTASEEEVKRWDLRSKAVVGEMRIPGLNVLEMSYGLKLVAAHGKAVSLYDPLTFEQTRAFATPEDVECASLAPDGNHLVLGSKIKVKEYTLDGQELEQHRGHHGPIFHVRYSPDNMTYASGSEDGMVRVWPTSAVLRQMEEN